MTRRRAGLVVTASAAGSLAFGCAETTIDSPAPTVAQVGDGAGDTVPPATAPAGTPAELSARLLDEVGGLSGHVVEGEGQDESLARIEALWAVIRPDVERARLDLLDGFEAGIDLARSAVERRRPADADKARINLTTLVAAYLG